MVIIVVKVRILFWWSLLLHQGFSLTHRATFPCINAAPSSVARVLVSAGSIGGRDTCLWKGKKISSWVLAGAAEGVVEDGNGDVLPTVNGVVSNQDFDENGKFNSRTGERGATVLPTTSSTNSLNTDKWLTPILSEEKERDQNSDGGGEGGNDRGVALQDRGGVSKDRLAFPLYSAREVDRLFSTLEPCDVSGFKRKPSNLLGATALVSGTAVGAGILALPAATLQAGLIPSSVGLIGMWAYMACTAMLIAEVNVNVICQQGTPGVGLIALAEQALGKGGARFAGLVYVFIHYSLLVAYIAQGGGLLNEAANAFLTSGAEAGMMIPSLPDWAGPTAFCATFASLLLFCSEEVVNNVNSFFVGVVLLSFAGLVVLGSGGVQVENLTNQDWSKVPSAVPVMYIAMVFHNVVPVVTTQLEGDIDKIRKAIVGGSLGPLLMFLVWNAVILGSVPKDAGLVAEAAGGVFDPLQALRQGAHVEEGVGTLLSPLIGVFSEVAIVTSFIGFIVGLLDFFTDVLKIPPGDKSKELPLYGAILLPPLAIAITDPDIFFAALDTAGTFGTSFLCGVLPAAMAWSQRYSDANRIEKRSGEQEEGEDENGESILATLPLVPGGKATLAGMAGFAGVVIFQKLLEMCGVII